MGEPYTIRIFMPDGDPEGVKIVDRVNWTGKGIAFPRKSWQQVSIRQEFRRSGVYILTGSAEGKDDNLPMIYIGQADEIGPRIESHLTGKDFWDWGFVFVSSGDPLNRAYITWLEHRLIHLAKRAKSCHLDNTVHPKEPSLSESDRSDAEGFLREMLLILPLLGVRAFEELKPVATPGSDILSDQTPANASDERDTVVVPAWEDGFREVFIGENCWHAIRISGGMISKIKYIAVYQVAPVSAITYYASVDRIEPYGDKGKYKLVFSKHAEKLKKPIPFADGAAGPLQGPRYTSLKKLLAAKKVSDLFI